MLKTIPPCFPTPSANILQQSTILRLNMCVMLVPECMAQGSTLQPRMLQVAVLWQKYSVILWFLRSTTMTINPKQSHGCDHSTTITALSQTIVTAGLRKLNDTTTQYAYSMLSYAFLVNSSVMLQSAQYRCYSQLASACNENSKNQALTFSVCYK